MSSELVSKKTRNEFREYLVGWTLREISHEFDAAGVMPDQNHDPGLGGERRKFVEQHYHTLDFTDAADVAKLLAAYENVLDRATRRASDLPDPEAEQRKIAYLIKCLEDDGFVLASGKLSARSKRLRQLFGPRAVPEAVTISELTRRNLFDELRLARMSWSGRLSETDFLQRIYDLNQLPSFDSRYTSALGDIFQHRENNLDWDDDWVFEDSRFELMDGADQTLLTFLCEMVHPVVRQDETQAAQLVELFNKHLHGDGWRLGPGERISGKPKFVAQRLAAVDVRLHESHSQTLDILSDEYVRELSSKCDSRLASGDLEGAITIGRTVLEAILYELETRLSGKKGDYKGDLPKQFKQVAKLLRMDDERPELDERFKDVVRGLITIVNGLAPLRNKMSDGHARVRKPAPHHARVVVNAAKTVAAFVVDSYHYQVKKGLIGAKDAAGSGKKS